MCGPVMTVTSKVGRIYLQSATRVCALGINGLSGLARRLTNYFDISYFFPHTQRPVVFRIVGSTAAVG